ncbi:MAG: GNAT family N-acetyltransferase [Burkholderiaceae bacterium]
MTDATTLRPGDAIAAADWHAAFTAAFADYLIGPFQLALAQWPGFLARQGVDLGLSRGAVGPDGTLRAFALVAPRPEIGRWRLATMGAVPAARGSGAAAALLDDLVARATAAGLDTLELEAFTANERALRLYRGRGFEVVQALVGHERAADTPPRPSTPSTSVGPAAIAEPTLAEAWAWLADAERRIADLPLQVTGRALASSPVPLQAWRLGGAQLVFGAGPAERSITLHSLVDPQPAQADAEALVAALCARWPGHAQRVPPLQRDDLGGRALARLGFAPAPLHQWLMRRPL